METDKLGKRVKMIEHSKQTGVKGCSPDLQKKWSGGYDKAKVTFMRVVHSQ